MSGRTYDTAKFEEAGSGVVSFPWEDHHSPALNVLFEACQKMHEFLKSKCYDVLAPYYRGTQECSGGPLQRGEGTHRHTDKLLHDILWLRCQLTGGNHLLRVEKVQSWKGCHPAFAGQIR